MAYRLRNTTLAAAIGATLLGVLAQAAEPGIDVTVTVDFGQDLGQNFGTLFEARDAQGRLTFGAGFASVYNTYYRAERYKVQFFIRPQSGAGRSHRQRLPRATSGTGSYVFDWDGKVYSEDWATEKVWQWRPADNTWTPSPVRGRSACIVRGRPLRFAGGRIRYGETVILDRPKEGGRSHLYYGQGHLFFYHRKISKAGESFNRVCAVPWSPYADDLRARPSQLKSIDATSQAEIPLAYGQLGRQVVNCSNLGGLYAFDGRKWRVVVAADKTSYQIYSMINHDDRLLMGQYPTGLLFAYDGREVTALKGWPPVLPGAGDKAREVQTTMIYRGELLVGVWPWAELWRRDPDRKRWVSMGRMFTHPDIQAKPLHPYEKEAQAAGIVSNALGQRLTSMAPLADALLIGTARKDPWADDQAKAAANMGPERLDEYGRVYRLTMPGNLAVSIAWRDKPTTLRFLAGGDRMAIFQDGKLLAEVEAPASLTSGLPAATTIQWGRGVFGPLSGVIKSHQAKQPHSDRRADATTASQPSRPAFSP